MLDGLDVTLPLLLITLIGTSVFFCSTAPIELQIRRGLTYEYSGLAAVMILAFAVFGDIPSALEATGMVLIVGAGIYIFYRERVRDQDAAAEATLR